MKRIPFFHILILLSALLVSPQISSASEKRSSATVVNQEIIRAVDFLYDWEFDKAEEMFQEVIAESPSEPVGYFYLAMVTWSRLTSGFWSKDVVREFGKRIDKAIYVAKRRIKEDEKDSYAYFYLGGALGFKGRFKLMQSKWLSSFDLAYHAIQALKTCQRIDPTNKDVLFGLGIFDYYTARLSGVMKFLSFLFLHKGDKEEGLRKLHIAADEATYSFIEAKSLLLHIYLFLEPLEGKALPLAKELAGRFKNNPRARVLLGLTYIKLGMGSKYREVVESLKKRGRKEKSKAKAEIWAHRALYLEASYYLYHEQYEQARSRLDEILSRADPVSDPIMAAWPLIKKGMIHDMEKEREEAMKYYKSVLKMKNGAGAQFLALKYIDEPARKKNPFLGY